METRGITPTGRALLTLRAVEQLTGYKKSKLYNLIAAGAFPQPVRLNRDIRFPSDEIDAWVAQKIAERDATLGTRAPVLVNERECAAAIGVSVSWLQKDRGRDDGPRIPFVRVGPFVRYDLEVVKAAAQAQEIGAEAAA